MIINAVISVKEGSVLSGAGLGTRQDQCVSSLGIITQGQPPEGIDVNYYNHHIGDYLKDTAHLSLLEHGVYRRLIDVYYSREKPLPLDITECCRLIGAVTHSEKTATAKTLNEFFFNSAFGFTHKRCDEEIAKYQAKSLKAKESANARWNANALRTHSEGNAPNNQEPITNIKDKDTYVETEISTIKVPIQKIVELYHQLLPQLPRCMKLTKKRIGYIQQRWREDMPELKNWENFFAHVSKSEFLTGKSRPINGHPVFRADIEWLCNPTNFTKIAEGKYHVRRG